MRLTSKEALNKMKKGKASGCSGVASELLGSSELGIAGMINLFNQIIAENKAKQSIK